MDFTTKLQIVAVVASAIAAICNVTVVILLIKLFSE